MNQAEKAKAFAAMHVKGDPLVLFNIWDAGSAKVVAEAGAPAVATGSWSVAAAHGYQDGESIPLELLEVVTSRIAATVDAPLTVDFEGGYAAGPEGIAANVGRIIRSGAIGVNFRDQIVGGDGLYEIDIQATRLQAAVQAGEENGVALFVNARTDIFLKERDRSRHPALLQGAKDRAAAYAEAGASGFFAPGLVDIDLVADLCGASSLPVNILIMPEAPSHADLAKSGVARISYGPGPYRRYAAMLAEMYRTVMQG